MRNTYANCTLGDVAEKTKFRRPIFFFIVGCLIAFLMWKAVSYTPVGTALWVKIAVITLAEIIPIAGIVRNVNPKERVLDELANESQIEGYSLWYRQSCKVLRDELTQKTFLECKEKRITP